MAASSQDTLIEQLRSEGRRQAAHRSVGRKREFSGDEAAGGADAGAHGDGSTGLVCAIQAPPPQLLAAASAGGDMQEALHQPDTEGQGLAAVSDVTGD